MECRSKTWLEEQKMFVNCGKCVFCKMQKATDWSARMLHESGYHKSSLFVTLTFDEDHCPLSIKKEELQKYLKRLRKRLSPRKIRYYACGEYGEEMGRPHYHLIIFGVNYNDFEFKDKILKNGMWHDVYDCESWMKGNVYLGDVTADSCRYVADYINKVYFGDMEKEVYKNNGLESPFQLYSKGLGEKWIYDNEKQLRQRYGYTIKGKNRGLNRYYRNKLEIEGSEYYEKIKDKIKENKSIEEMREMARLRLKALMQLNITEDECKVTLSKTAQKTKNINAQRALKAKRKTGDA